MKTYYKGIEVKRTFETGGPCRKVCIIFADGRAIYKKNPVFTH
jgi:hypothetical protein